MTWWTRNDEEWPDWTDSEDELKEQEEELAAEEKNAEKDELNGEVGESGQDLAYLGEDEISEFVWSGLSPRLSEPRWAISVIILSHTCFKMKKI